MALSVMFQYLEKILPSHLQLWVMTNMNTHLPSYYSHFKIRKPNGTFRLIEEPVPELKEVQRLLIPGLAKHITNPDVYGITGGNEHSAISHACQHNNEVIIKMDIKDFFPSTTVDLWWKRFETIQVGEGYLDNLLFIKDEKTFRLPTGAPTSPVVANLCFGYIDSFIQNILFKYYPGVRYTRYMDDMCFSCEEYPDGLQSRVVKAIESSSPYRVNHRKSQVLYRNNDSQIVTGVLVNNKNKISAPKSYRRLLRAELDLQAKKFVAGEEKISNEHLDGKISYLKSIDVKDWEKLIDYYRNRIFLYSQLKERGEFVL